VNASECTVGIAHRFNNPNQQIKSSIRRGDVCRIHSDSIKKFVCNAKSPPLSLDSWEVSRVQRVTEGSAARRRRDAVQDPSDALRLPPPLLRGEDKNQVRNPVLLMAFVLLMACAPTRATQSSNAVATAKAGVVSLVVNPLGDAVCVASDTSVAVFSRAATRGQLGHTWFEAPARVSSLAWFNNAWWLALPRVGLVQKADGVPQSVAVAGQPMLLSNRLIFTLEGDVFRYDGSRVGRLPKLPSSLVDGQNVTFVISGKEAYSIGNTILRLRQLEDSNYSLLLGHPMSLLPEEVDYRAVRGLAVSQADYTYTLETNTVKVSGLSGQLLKTIILPSAASKIAVGGDTLAVAIGSSVMFFDAQSFTPLITRACEVTR
jgi:hypothetical protein